MKESLPASSLLNCSSQYFFSQRLKLHYVDWGNPDAPPLLLIHGGRDHSRAWDWVADRLCKDWHVIAPDLRGHGESSWSPEGNYSMAAFTYDLAQLLHHLDMDKVNIVAHSLGGAISLRYTGLFPESVRKLVVIEGMRPPPEIWAEQSKAYPQRMRDWVENKRKTAGRTVKRYASLAQAQRRMKEENHHLSDGQVQHLTLHGINRNEDGTYSWKFDNYLRVHDPVDISQDEIHELWSNVSCPTMLMYGKESWASNPEEDGRLSHFPNAHVVEYENAGHWLHHDQLEKFVADVDAFLR